MSASAWIWAGLLLGSGAFLGLWILVRGLRRWGEQEQFLARSGLRPAPGDRGFLEQALGERLVVPPGLDADRAVRERWLRVLDCHAARTPGGTVHQLQVQGWPLAEQPAGRRSARLDTLFVLGRGPQGAGPFAVQIAPAGARPAGRESMSSGKPDAGAGAGLVVGLRDPVRLVPVANPPGFERVRLYAAAGEPLLERLPPGFVQLLAQAPQHRVRSIVHRDGMVFLEAPDLTRLPPAGGADRLTAAGVWSYVVRLAQAVRPEPA